MAATALGSAALSDAWWREGVLYEIYPRSFRDANGDGHGDLPGVLERLEHLEWLGVDGVWLNPTMPSPNADWGYDVADYTGVHPDFGTLDDLDRLVAEAGRRGIRVLLDLVPNHTSDRHPWFEDALTSREARHRDWYVWADGEAEPNNWQGAFGGSAWTFHEATGQWYLHNFLPEQPDLNWFNPEVRDAFDGILRFWLDRGVAGFRIDVSHAIVKDRELRDDPPATADDHPHVRSKGLRQVHSMNRPETHDVLRRWRRLTGEYEGAALVGETYVFDLDQLLRFYGTGTDELHLAFNIPFVHATLDPDEMRPIVEAMEAGLPEGAWPVWTGSNHDAGRLTSRWAGGDEARARCALVMLLTLRGTPFLYAGDEIALPDGAVGAGRVRDMAGRDGGRTPMLWGDGPGGGFTDGAAEPWLPMDYPATARGVEEQRVDPASTLHLTRDLIALRRAERDLRAGAYATLAAPEGAWAWRRGESHAVAINLGSEPVTIDGLAGEVAIGTDRSRDGTRFDGRLQPAEGVVLRGAQPPG